MADEGDDGDDDNWYLTKMKALLEKDMEEMRPRVMDMDPQDRFSWPPRTRSRFVDWVAQTGDVDRCCRLLRLSILRTASPSSGIPCITSFNAEEDLFDRKGSIRSSPPQHTIKAK